MAETRPRLTDRESILRLVPPLAEAVEDAPAWPPEGYVAVLVPAAVAKELIEDDEAIACRWSVEEEDE